MSSRYVRVWYAVVISVVAFAVIGVTNLWYTNHVQQQADQRWCRLFGIMNPDGAPPTTERGRVIAEEIERMRRESFRCPPKDLIP